MKKSNLLTRVVSAVVLSPIVVLLIVFAPPLAVLAVLSAVAGIMSSEIFSMFFPTSFSWGRFACGLSSAALCAAVSLFDAHPLGTLLVLGAVPILSFLSFMFIDADPSVSSRGPFVCLSTSLYSGALLGFSGLLFSSANSGSLWLITLLCATFIGDTGAYAFGRWIGGPKLAPRLSPGKTWAGAAGGVFATTLSLVVCNFFFLEGVPWLYTILFGPFLSVACQVGDLAESFLKRGLGFKDSGSLIPGHGGLLDRCDALLFSGPCMYIFFLMLHPR